MTAEERVTRIREFNRFYTREIGVLTDHLLGSPFSLAEVRVLYEVANRAEPKAADLATDLELDPGYLSRILRKLENGRLLARRQSEEDGRCFHLVLTDQGREEFAKLDRASQKHMRERIRAIPATDQDRILDSMDSIERLLSKTHRETAGFVLRGHRPGDMGWVVQRHGEIYAADYGWDETFEALAAEIVADFLKTYDQKRARCWIAQRSGERAGCVFVVPKDEQIAKLRLLLVEPFARGTGLGRQLVDECIRFAREAGYRRMTLWTQSMLTPARRIYQNAGFELVRSEPHHSFGVDLVGETWEMDL